MDPIAKARQLMLISNSFCHGGGYLEHCAGAIKSLLGSTRPVTFIPYALADWDGYVARARDAFAKMDIELIGINEMGNHPHRLAETRAIFIGGGNTFRLLDRLQSFHLLKQIADLVNHGVPYIGASAGSNVAGPTIMTTNDMPIVWPTSLHALNLVPFQINPHFFDPEPGSKHMGETRRERIKQFHEEQAADVVGLREGSWITVLNGQAHLRGTSGAMLFRRDEEPVEWDPSAPLMLD